MRGCWVRGERHLVRQQLSSGPLLPGGLSLPQQTFARLSQSSLLVNWLNTHSCPLLQVDLSIQNTTLPTLHLRAAWPASPSSPRADTKPISPTHWSLSTQQPLARPGCPAALVPGMNPLRHSPETQLHPSLPPSTVSITPPFCRVFTTQGWKNSLFGSRDLRMILKGKVNPQGFLETL